MTDKIFTSSCVLPYSAVSDFMGLAYKAALDSPDPSSQNGAVLVRDTGFGYAPVAYGVNHFYKGVTPIVDDRTEKLKRIEHAERDCLYAAAYAGFTTRNSILVCPWAACWDCARAIIGCGVSILVYHQQRFEETDVRWKAEVDAALEAISNAGVYILALDGPIPNTQPIRISGRLWNPSTCEYINANS